MTTSSTGTSACPRGAGLYPLDFVDDVLALDDLAEHAVSPSLELGAV